MKRKAKQSLGVLKTTAIGGIFFLLPLAVILFLIGQLLHGVWTVAQALEGYFPVRNFWGYLLLFLLAVGLVLLGCFAAGLLARRQFAMRFNESVEKRIMAFFPQYTVIKQRLTGNLAEGGREDSLRPVLVRLAEHWRIGFEVDRIPARGDARGWVTVYLPSSPDPWSGEVILVRADQTEPLSSDMAETLAAFERIGRGTHQLFGSPPAPT